MKSWAEKSKALD